MKLVIPVPSFAGYYPRRCIAVDQRGFVETMEPDAVELPPLSSGNAGMGISADFHRIDFVWRMVRRQGAFLVWVVWTADPSLRAAECKIRVGDQF